MRVEPTGYGSVGAIRPRYRGLMGLRCRGQYTMALPSRAAILATCIRPSAPLEFAMNEPSLSFGLRAYCNWVRFSSLQFRSRSCS